jgi:hypothetical protein
LSNAISAPIEMIMWFLSFVPLMWYITYWYLYIKSFLSLNHKYKLIMLLIFVMGIEFCLLVFFKEFCLQVSPTYWHKIFSYSVFDWLWYQSNADLIRWV